MQPSPSPGSQLPNNWDSDSPATSGTTSFESPEFGVFDDLLAQPSVSMDDVAGAATQFVDGNYEDFSLAGAGTQSANENGQDFSFADSGTQFVDENYEDFPLESLGLDQDWLAEMEKALAAMD
jgi:hypothetical protein